MKLGEVVCWDYFEDFNFLKPTKLLQAVVVLVSKGKSSGLHIANDFHIFLSDLQSSRMKLEF